jgi:fatty-acyl-CoA synthase
MAHTAFHNQTIPFFLERRAKESPNKRAFYFPQHNQDYTWAQVWNEVKLLAANFIKIGLTKGDRIAILMEGRMELILSLFASACIGAVAVPLNTYSKKEELTFYLKDAQPSILIMGETGQHLHYLSIFQSILSEHTSNTELHSLLPRHVYVLGTNLEEPHTFFRFEELINHKNLEAASLSKFISEVHPKDPLILLYTSGTSGTPKGVIRSTSSFLGSTNPKKSYIPLIQRISNRITSHFIFLNLMPLYHLGGYASLLAVLESCQVQMAMLSHYNPSHALKILDEVHPHILSGTPYMIQQMLSSPEFNSYHYKSVFGIAFGSSAVSATLVKRAIEAFHLSFFIVSYGSTEAGSVATGTCLVVNKKQLLLRLIYNSLKNTGLLSGLIRLEQVDECPFSLAGKVAPHVNIQIQDLHSRKPLPPYKEGEICIQSHRVMPYTSDDNKNEREERWFQSGDIGYLDANNCLIITGRLKRMISRGGEKISPVEVENWMIKNLMLVDAFIVGVPDQLYGEEMAAFVIPKKGVEVTQTKLQQEIKAHLSAFKVPKYIFFLEQFPLSPTGKVAIKLMREMALDLITQEEGRKKNA